MEGLQWRGFLGRVEHNREVQTCDAPCRVILALPPRRNLVSGTRLPVTCFAIHRHTFEWILIVRLSSSLPSSIYHFVCTTCLLHRPFKTCIASNLCSKSHVLRPLLFLFPFSFFFVHSPLFQPLLLFLTQLKPRFLQLILHMRPHCPVLICLFIVF